MKADVLLNRLGFARRLAAPLLLVLAACGDPTIVDVEVGVDASDGGPSAPAAGSGGVSAGGAGGQSGAGPQAGEGAMGGTGGAGGEAADCRKVEAESLPARKEVTTTEPVKPPTMTLVITADELFDLFNAQQCGSAACHGGKDEPLNQSPEVFKVTRASFDQRPNLGDQALERVLSPDPRRAMPLGAGPGDKRGPDDPNRRLAERLKAWQDAGFPEELELEVPVPEDPTGEDLPEDPYLLSPELAESFTNIGNCIPDPATPRNLDAMRRMDELFQNVDGFDDLPETLVETDMISLDSAVLARRGVFSYAPTYTLFSDNASKMRYIRVPVGKSVTYNEETGDFDIPENTRFYKTFLKPVTDKDGTLAYRKMETRIIVSRRDEALPDGSFRPRALRASYAWDKDEKMARLVKDPFRNGEPFADRFCPYVVDERVTRDPAHNPIVDSVQETCTYMTKAEREDLSTGSIRHYAIPSSERCDQCHMGSSSQSYILGFSPWQADRRAPGEGGIYDKAPTQDELEQLQRLTEYGVVVGIEPGEAKLEDSQGDRLPRNEHELKAQAYMMGNCAFCHNPTGFPTVQNPLLLPFNMFPDQDAGGIFQFSIERSSPRAKFGDAQVTRYPYITPAFGNYPMPPSATASPDLKELEGVFSFPPVLDPLDAPPDFDALSSTFSFLAPWRSLLWRNVYTPFTYSEDSTIFIHMPRNVPDYDCRAHKIMASWMLSIPSRLKLDPFQDQPAEEVSPDEPEFARQARLAEERVNDYLLSVTGQHCPDTSDTVDPGVVNSLVRMTSTGQLKKLQPAPIDDKTLDSPRLVEGLDPLFEDAVPQRGHWVPVDTTDAPGRWIPRRSNWKSVLVTGEVAVSAEQARVIDQINAVHLSQEQEEFSLTPQPTGLWHPDCNALAMDSPTVAELQAQGPGSMREWLFSVTPILPPQGRVHYQSRGEAVFRAICQNCHGRQADSRSPLATTILELTGAQTRVANFVDGLFGPRSAPGTYAEDEFMVDQGATPSEWQVRYMLFMALGGTEVDIPQDVLSLVSKSPFYGQGVQTGRSIAATANMLQSAGQTCQQLINGVRWEILPGLHGQGLRMGIDKLPSGALPFVVGNAHYELWESLCGYQNEPIIRVFRPGTMGGALLENSVAGTTPYFYRSRDRAGRSLIPATSPIGNQRAEIELGLQADNTLPWCVRRGSGADDEAMIQLFVARGFSEADVPFCPDALFALAYGQELHQFPYQFELDPSHINAELGERWVRHGAMNAGIAAYYYLDRLTKGEITPLPTYDACKN